VSVGRGVRVSWAGRPPGSPRGLGPATEDGVVQVKAVANLVEGALLRHPCGARAHTAVTHSRCQGRTTRQHARHEFCMMTFNNIGRAHPASGPPSPGRARPAPRRSGLRRSHVRAGAAHRGMHTRPVSNTGRPTCAAALAAARSTAVRRVQEVVGRALRLLLFSRARVEAHKLLLPGVRPSIWSIALADAGATQAVPSQHGA
jgi:hypothetical protein